MAKKASSEMWWIIIGAVIALIVLIVLLVMFTGKTKNLEGGLGSCGAGGVCVEKGNCPAGTSKSEIFTCSDIEKPQCCIGIPKKCSSDADCVTNKEKCDVEGGYCYAK